MLMSEAVHPRAVSFPSLHPYLYSVRRLTQALPASCRPSPEVISRKPLGVLLTLLKSTLAGTFVSVASKRLTSRLTSVLTPLDATLTKNRGGGYIPRSLLLSVICVALLLSPSAMAQEKSSPPHRVSQIEVYESFEELHETLQEKPPLTFAAARAPQLTVAVNDAAKYQEMDGFGASLTESSAWLLSQKLTPPQRTALLKQLFDPKQGIGLAILRQPMGSSDFSLADYSYDDVPPGESDPEMKHFTIDRDRQYILPVLREALAVRNHEPHLGGCTNCRGVVTIDHSKSPATVTPTVDFAALAHASNFVAPGALRIDSIASEESPLKHVAFRNSDGSIVLLALNPSESAMTFSIAWQSQYATYTLQPGAVVTFHWPPKSQTHR